MNDAVKINGKTISRNGKLTQLGRVRSVFLTGEELTLPKIKDEIFHRYHVTDSESAISARIRDLPKIGMPYDRRVIPGGKLRGYTLVQS